LFRVEGLTHRVQVDLCDGRMGLEKTWLPYKETHLPAGFEYEFDLMVEDWMKFLPRVLSLGAKRVVMHIDDWEDHDFDMLYDVLSHHPLVSLGLSITNNGQVEILAKRVLEAESRHSRVFVQLMGINKIGAQGQPFDERVLARIEYVRRNCKGVPIQIDGSMNPETLFSHIFGSNNIRKTIDSLYLSFGD
jgi:pentose-5-phosphate-3-epimerase